MNKFSFAQNFINNNLSQKSSICFPNKYFVQEQIPSNSSPFKSENNMKDKISFLNQDDKQPGIKFYGDHQAFME